MVIKSRLIHISTGMPDEGEITVHSIIPAINGSNILTIGNRWRYCIVMSFPQSYKYLRITIVKRSEIFFFPDKIAWNQKLLLSDLQSRSFQKLQKGLSNIVGSFYSTTEKVCQKVVSFFLLNHFAAFQSSRQLPCPKLPEVRHVGVTRYSRSAFGCGFRRRVK
jgi:hypothetical protein